MGCHLILTGRELDLDWVSANCDLSPAHIWRRGEPRIGKRTQLHAASGIKFSVSNADGHHLAIEVQEAQDFLNENKSQLDTLRTAPGIENVLLDFAWHFPCERFMAQVNVFPAEFLRHCAALDIAIEVSVYLASDSPTV